MYGKDNMRENYSSVTRSLAYLHWMLLEEALERTCSETPRPHSILGACAVPTVPTA